MNQRHPFFSFKTKDQRRVENDLEKQRQDNVVKERADVIARRTHLDLEGRKGFVGLAHSMPAFLRHAKNLVYARWVRKPINGRVG